MALDFPSNPTVDDTYTLGTKTWVYNGAGWQLVGAAVGSSNTTNATDQTTGTYFFIGVANTGSVQTVSASKTKAIYFDAATGTLYAVAKSFSIPHPTKEGKQLRHVSLEGPEYGVYVRGKLNGSIIQLPEYWTKLVDQNTITVQLTPIEKNQDLYVEKIENNKVYVCSNNDEPNCYYFIQGERTDIDKLKVEID